MRGQLSGVDMSLGPWGCLAWAGLWIVRQVMRGESHSSSQKGGWQPEHSWPCGESGGRLAGAPLCATVPALPVRG